MAKLCVSNNAQTFLKENVLKPCITQQKAFSDFSTWKDNMNMNKGRRHQENKLEKIQIRLEAKVEPSICFKLLPLS